MSIEFTKVKVAIILMALSLLTPCARAEVDKPPVRIAIIGLVHAHVSGFLPATLASPDMQLVGIVEKDPQLVAACAAKYHLHTNLFFPTITEMLAKTNVQAVAAFTSILDHTRVVEECAPHGIQVMVEKPLAVNLRQARAIEAAAKKYGINVLVNYETTWYPGNQAAYDVVVEQHAIGDVRKIVVHDGHSGPKEIGCPPEFLAWLTDPVQNGGGALTDFGCYGADLMTWLMKGQRPTSVFAVTQQIKPDVYPKVEDEATIILTYPKAQGIIQASWNWPFSRKDMEIYGQTGQLLVLRSDLIRARIGSASETDVTPTKLRGPQASSLSYLAAVVRGEIKPSGLSSLDVNMIVMEILDAAKKSAAAGRRVNLSVK